MNKNACTRPKNKNKKRKREKNPRKNAGGTKRRKTEKFRGEKRKNPAGGGKIVRSLVFLHEDRLPLAHEEDGGGHREVRRDVGFDLPVRLPADGHHDVGVGAHARDSI